VKREGVQKKPHQDEVSHDGKGSAGKIETQKPACNPQSAWVRTVGPGPALMPEEVVDHRHLHGQSRGGHISPLKHTHEECQSSQLHCKSQRANAVEDDPAAQRWGHSPDRHGVLD
jgi:hypothetical protein